MLFQADTPVGVRCEETGLQDFIRLQKHHQVRYIIYDINKEEVCVYSLIHIIYTLFSIYSSRWAT